MKWIFDLDGTICDTEYKDGKWLYKDSKPNKLMVKSINELFDMGHHITIYTARGSLTGVDYREITLKQLDKWGLKYNKIRFDKPGGEIYVDDRTISPNEFLTRLNFYMGISSKSK